MPSIEDYAPDGGNAPVVPPTAEEDRARAKAALDIEALKEAAQRPVRGTNSAMVIPTARGFFDLDEDQRADLLTRPKVYVLPDDVTDGELNEDQVIADGPWMALALENGEWVTGELVGVIADSITLRKIHSLDDDGITYWDTTVETARCVVWHTLEGDRWAMPTPGDEPGDEPDQPLRSVDPLTGFPTRAKS